MSQRSGLLVALALIAVTALAALVWWLRPPVHDPLPLEAPGNETVEAAPMALAPIAALPPAEAQPLVVEEAESIDAPAVPAAGGTALQDTPRAPSTLNVFVVDSLGRPVPGATVDVTKSTNRLGAEAMERALSTTGGAIDRDQIAQLVEAMRRRGGPGGAPFYPNEMPMTATTNTEGRARLDVDGWALIVSAAKEGVGTAGPVAVPDDWKTGAPVRVELTPQAMVTGVVFDTSGLPVEGATVSASPGFASERGARELLPEPVTTDAEGRFSLPFDAPLTVDIVARRGDEASLASSLRLLPGHQQEIDLHFVGAYGVDGVVTGPDGSAVPGVSVQFVPSYWPGPSPVMTDEDGIFAFDLAQPGDYEFGVTELAGLVQAEPAVARVLADQPRVPITIRLIEAETITGRAEWADGSPVARASIFAMPVLEEDEEGRRFFGFWSVLSVSSRPQAGAFQLAGLHPGFSYKLSGTAYGPRGKCKTITLLPGQRDVVLVFEPRDETRVTLHGRVVDSQTGNPIPEYEIAHGNWSRGLSGKGKTVRVHDLAGRFEVTGSRASPQAFVVKAEGYPPRTFGPLDASEESSDLVLELERLGGLTVAVVDAAGAPASGAVVVLGTPVSQQVPELFGDLQTHRTDAEGMLIWPDLPPGRYLIQAGLGAQLSDLHFVDVAGETHARADVALAAELSPGSLRVRVQPRGGQIVEGATFSANNMLARALEGADAMGHHRAEGNLDSTGTGVFEGLRPGYYSVWAKVTDGFDPPRRFPVSSGQETSVTFGSGQ